MSLGVSLAVGLSLGGMATPAWALYKVVGPDGRVTYTDRPPAEGATGVPQPLSVSGARSEPGALPYEVKQAVAAFPVVLYTGKACAPCDQGRELLKKRGIPFTEKTLSTDADLSAFQRLEGPQEVPVLKVGRQRLKGFLDTEWHSTLDSAGYPKTSRLPAGHAWPAPTPLSAAVPAAQPSPTAAPPAAAPDPSRLEEVRKGLPKRLEPEPAVRF